MKLNKSFKALRPVPGLQSALAGAGVFPQRDGLPLTRGKGSVCPGGAGGTVNPGHGARTWQRRCGLCIEGQKVELQLQVPSGLRSISLPEIRPRGRRHRLLPLLLAHSWPFVVLPGQGPAFCGSVCTDMSAGNTWASCQRDAWGCPCGAWPISWGPCEGNSSGKGEEKPVGGGISRRSGTGVGEAGEQEL